MKQHHSQAAPETPQQRVLEKVTAFLTRYRTPILIIVVVIVVAVLALIAVLTIQNNRSEAALQRAEALEADFDRWLGLEDDEKPAEYDVLAQTAIELIDAYPRTYAASRAWIIDARALLELDRYEDAVSRYVEVADNRPETYLAPVSLMDAAVAAENGGDVSRSLELHRRIVDEYEGESAEVPRALFSIGRILEQRDEVAEAAEAYRQLVDDYPASSWTNLAHDRIITLTVEGRIGG